MYEMDENDMEFNITVYYVNIRFWSVRIIRCCNINLFLYEYGYLMDILLLI